MRVGAVIRSNTVYELQVKASMCVIATFIMRHHICPRVFTPLKVRVLTVDI